jgi:hypothetical protein
VNARIRRKTKEPNLSVGTFHSSVTLDIKILSNCQRTRPSHAEDAEEENTEVQRTTLASSVRLGSIKTLTTTLELMEKSNSAKCAQLENLPGK